MWPYRLQQRAEKELWKAVFYLEKKKAGLGEEFLNEYETELTRIRENPHIGAQWKLSPFRHWVIRRFGYVIYYQLEDEEVVVVAVAHGRRRPDYWRRRKLE